MSATIYEKTPNGLYPTGDRTVSTFQSGLVRVDQTFFCKTSAAAYYRAELSVGNDFPNGVYPSFDGLKIFPDAQEIQRTDGFTEFKVSGYGRTNTSGTVIKTYKEFYTTRQQGSGIVTRFFKSKDHTTSRVVLSFEEYDSTIDLSGIDSPVLISGPATVNYPDYQLTKLGAQQINNFGFFQEITTTYGYVGYSVA